MNGPKLKHPRLCLLILVILYVLVPVALPIGAAMCERLPDGIYVLVLLGALVLALYLIFKNWVVCFIADGMLDLIHCHQTARKRYPLPKGFSPEKLQEKISRFGQGCDPLPLTPQPEALRYRFRPSMVLDASGHEQVIALYRTEMLDKAGYHAMMNAARANFKAVEGRTKPRFLDRQQKKSPLHRVLVVYVLAERVDAFLAAELFGLVQKQAGDGLEVTILPCVMDLSQSTCVFDGVRIPYVFTYPVKNRGIRRIRRMVFGGRLPLRNEEAGVMDQLWSPGAVTGLEGDLGPDSSLWELLAEIRRGIRQGDKHLEKQFQSMQDRDVAEDADYLYVRWGDRGVWLAKITQPDTATVELDVMDTWAWPKSNPMGKKDIAAVSDHIRAWYARQGYTAVFDNER